MAGSNVTTVSKGTAGPEVTMVSMGTAGSEVAAVLEVTTVSEVTVFGSSILQWTLTFVNVILRTQALPPVT